MALNVLLIPVIAADLERLFSSAGLTVTVAVRSRDELWPPTKALT